MLHDKLDAKSYDKIGGAVGQIGDALNKYSMSDLEKF